jgi:hypothetical protein
MNNPQLEPKSARAWLDLLQLRGKPFDVNTLVQLMNDLSEGNLEVDDIEALYRHRRSRHG